MVLTIAPATEKLKVVEVQNNASVAKIANDMDELVEVVGKLRRGNFRNRSATGLLPRATPSRPQDRQGSRQVQTPLDMHSS